VSHFHGEISERVRKLEQKVEQMQRVDNRVVLSLALYLAAASESFSGVGRRDAERSLKALKGDL
jgi:hypothetical protein